MDAKKVFRWKEVVIPRYYLSAAQGCGEQPTSRMLSTADIRSVEAGKLWLHNRDLEPLAVIDVIVRDLFNNQ